MLLPFFLRCSFDQSSGVVWRFVEVSSLDGNLKTSSSQKDYNCTVHQDSIRAFIECVDHYDFRNEDFRSRDDDLSSSKDHRFYLSSDLALVNDLTQAAAWTVSLYDHGNFRDGPGDISVQIALAEWGAGSMKMVDQRQLPTSLSGARNRPSAGANERVLCVKSSTKEVVLVPYANLGQSDPKTGLFLYDVAWELTPDAEAPTKEGMNATNDMIPLENYLELDNPF